MLITGDPLAEASERGERVPTACAVLHVDIARPRFLTSSVKRPVPNGAVRPDASIRACAAPRLATGRSPCHFSPPVRMSLVLLRLEGLSARLGHRPQLRIPSSTNNVASDSRHADPINAPLPRLPLQLVTARDRKAR